jgi:phage shock protein E
MTFKLTSTIIGPLCLIALLVSGFNFYKSKQLQQEKAIISEAIKKGALLVDVRTPKEFSEGSVEGAINIPLDSIEYKLDQFAGHPYIVVFCRTGNRSGTARRKLINAGLENIINGGPWQHVQEIVNSLKQPER